MVTKVAPANLIRHSQGTSDSDEHLAMKSSSSKSSSTKTLSTPTTSISEDGHDPEDIKPTTGPISHIPINDSEDTIQSSRETTGMMSIPGTDLSSISEEDKSLPLCESTKIHDNEETHRHGSQTKPSTLEVAHPSLQHGNKIIQRSSSSSTSSDNFLREGDVESPSTSFSNASADVGGISNLQGSTTIQLSHGNNSRANPNSLNDPSPPQTTFNLETIVTSIPTRLKSLSGDSMNRASSIRLLISQRQHRYKADTLTEDQAIGNYKDLTNMDIVNSDVPERKRPLTSWKGDRSAVSSIINRHSKYMKFVSDAGYHESDEDSSATSSPKSRLDYIIDQLEQMDDSEIAELYKNGELDWLHEHGIDPESIIPRPTPNPQDLTRNSNEDEKNLSTVMSDLSEDGDGTAAFISRTGPVQRQYAPSSSNISLAYHTADPSPQTEMFEENDPKSYAYSPIRDPNAFANPALMRTPNTHNQESPSTLTPSTLIALEEAPMLNLKQGDAPESRKTSPLRTRKILTLQKESDEDSKLLKAKEHKDKETGTRYDNEDNETEVIKPLYIKYRNRSEGESGGTSKSASQEPECQPQPSRTNDNQVNILAELFKTDDNSKEPLKDLDFEDVEEREEFEQNEDILPDNGLDLRPSSLTLPPSPFNGPTPPDFDNLIKKTVKSVLTSNLSAPSKMLDPNTIADGKFAVKNSSMTSIDRVQRERNLSKNLALMENSTPIRQLLNDDSLSIDGALMPPPTPPPKDSPSHKLLARKVKKQRRRQQKEAERKKQKEQEALNKLENRVPSKETSHKTVEVKPNDENKPTRKQTHNNFLKEFEKPRGSDETAMKNMSRSVTPKKEAHVKGLLNPKLSTETRTCSETEQPNSHINAQEPKVITSPIPVVSDREMLNSLYWSEASKKTNGTNTEVMQNSRSEISDVSMVSKDSFADAQTQSILQGHVSSSLPPIVKPFSVNPYNLPNNSETRLAGFDYATPYKNAAMARAKRLEVETLPDPTIDTRCEVLPSEQKINSPIDTTREADTSNVKDATSSPPRVLTPPVFLQFEEAKTTVTGSEKEGLNPEGSVNEIKTHLVSVESSSSAKEDTFASPSIKLPEIRASPVRSMVDAVAPKDVTSSPTVPPRRRNPGLSPLPISSETFITRPAPEVKRLSPEVKRLSPEVKRSSPEVVGPSSEIRGPAPDTRLPVTESTASSDVIPKEIVTMHQQELKQASSFGATQFPNADDTDSNDIRTTGRKPPPPINNDHSSAKIEVSDIPVNQKQGFLQKKSSKSSFMSNDVPEKPKKGFKKVFTKIFKKSGSKPMFEVVEPKKNNTSQPKDSITTSDAVKEEEEKSLTTEDLSLSLPPLELESPNLFDDMFTTFDEIDKRKSFLSGGPNSIAPVRSGLVRQPFFFRDDELSTDQIMDQQLKDDKDNGVSSETSKNNSEEDLPSEKSGTKFFTKDILGDLPSLRAPAPKNVATDSVYIDENILFLQKEFNWKNLSFEGESRLPPMEPISPVWETVEVKDISQFEEGNRYLKLAKQFKLEVSRGEPLEVVVNKFEDDVTYRTVPESTTDGLKPILARKSKIPSHNPALINRGHSYNINLDYKQDLMKKKTITPPSSKTVQFDRKILINETFAPDQYRRYNKCVTQYTLTDPNEINKIKDELNAYKCNEMLIHTNSKKFTHFFY